MSDTPHTLSYELPANDLGTLQQVLQTVDPSGRDDIQSVKIQIVATNPIFPNEVFTAEPSESDEIAETTEPAEPAKTDEPTETPEPSKPSKPAEPDETAETTEPAEASEPTDQLLTDVTAGKVEELEQIETDERFKFRFSKAKVAAILYRSNPLTAREIYELLERTDWEQKYGTVSSALTRMKDEGLARKCNAGKNKWELTTEGRAAMRATVIEADSYPLGIADKITGVSPAGSREQVTAD